MKVAILCIVMLGIGAVLGSLLSRIGNDSVRNAEAEARTKSSRMSGVEAARSSTGSNQSLTGNSGAKQGRLSAIETAVSKYKNFQNQDFIGESNRINDLPDRKQFIARYLLMTAWGEHDPSAALAHLDDDPGLDNSDLSLSKRLVYSSWTISDPKAASFALTQSDDINEGSRFRRNVALTVAREWSDSNPEAAFEWLQTLDDDRRSSVMHRYAQNLYQNNPDIALNQTSRLAEADQKEAVQGLGRLWGRESDWTEVEEKLSQLGTDYQDAARLSALSPYSWNHPYEATEKISAIEQNSREKDRLVSNVLRQIGSDDPATSLEWGLPNTSEKSQRRVINRVFSPWVEEDPTAAGEWLLNQAPDSATNRMIDEYLEEVTESNDLTEKLRAMSNPSS